MRSITDRYQTDPEFRALVDVLASQIIQARYTPTEIREAAILASTIVESRTIRPMFVPLREFDDLRPTRRPAPPSTPPGEKLVTCERCQLRVPERLVTWGAGVRSSTAARCAACSPERGPEGEAKREEVIALRRARSSALASSRPQNHDDGGEGVPNP